MNTLAPDRTAGLILCGGRSSRMGSDKAALRFPDGPLLRRVLARMAPLVAPLAVSLAPGQPLPEGVVLPQGALIVRDGEPEQGPLWGLAEGFRTLAPLARRVVVLPVDMPFFTTEHMARLLEGLQGHRACLFSEQGFRNALTAAYSLDLLDKVEALLAQGKRRPLFISEGEPTRELTLPDEMGARHPLMDVDTPQAYREALLAEGVGVPGGAAVTVRLMSTGSPSLPAVSGLPAASIQPASSGQPAASGGWFALRALCADDVLDAAAVLYPERLLAHDQKGRATWSVRVASPESPESPPGILEPEAPLAEGMELHLEPRG